MTPRQARFVQEFLRDGNAAAAARRAGYSAKSARVNGPRLLSNAAVRQALQKSQAQIERHYEVDRQRTVLGLLEAIDLARANADPGGMIAGWKEIAKMLGYYEPERKSVAVTTYTQRVICEMEAMSDDELIAMASGGKH